MSDPIRAMAAARFPEMPPSRLDEWLRQPGMREALQAQVDAYLSAFAKVMGKRGGDARAAKLTPGQRTKIAQQAANVRWHGREATP